MLPLSTLPLIFSAIEQATVGAEAEALQRETVLAGHGFR
jgi:hypothetical protein